MSIVWGILASALAGCTAAMGLGGGFVLMIYLTLFAGVGAKEAGGINLVFFLVVGAVSLIFHAKNGLIEKPPLLPAILAGVLGAGGGFALGLLLDEKLLSRIFGGFVVACGLWQVFGKREEEKNA